MKILKRESKWASRLHTVQQKIEAKEVRLKHICDLAREGQGEVLTEQELDNLAVDERIDNYFNRR